MKLIRILLAYTLLFGCKEKAADLTAEKANINSALDNWHKAAGAANFNAYMEFLAPGAVYIGTDANERWTKNEFMVWAKPYFDKGKAWNFSALARHITVTSEGNIAWFDELLRTQMKICRGSGVLVKSNEGWKLTQYVLSMTMPNEKIKEAIDLKANAEDSIMLRLPH